MLAMLRGGDRRSIGRADRVATLVGKNPRLFHGLIQGLWSADAVVRMRAADATEKVTRKRPEWLRAYKKELLGLLTESQEQAVQWHLAALVPRLKLSAVERRAAFGGLQGYLEDRSSLVKTFALQGLVELSAGNAKLRAEALEILREAVRRGTAAMKARARKLLATLEN
jgi:hypothetical protein